MRLSPVVARLVEAANAQSELADLPPWRHSSQRRQDARQRVSLGRSGSHLQESKNLIYWRPPRGGGFIGCPAGTVHNVDDLPSVERGGVRR
jgi:hypothetical protein